MDGSWSADAPQERVGICYSAWCEVCASREVEALGQFPPPKPCVRVRGWLWLSDPQYASGASGRLAARCGGVIDNTEDNLKAGAIRRDKAVRK